MMALGVAVGGGLALRGLVLVTPGRGRGACTQERLGVWLNNQSVFNEPTCSIISFRRLTGQSASTSVQDVGLCCVNKCSQGLRGLRTRMFKIQGRVQGGSSTHAAGVALLAGALQ